MNEEYEKKFQKYKASIEARRHEIDLFWRRSLFYWGFLIIAFTGYGVMSDKNEYLSIMFACLGLLASCIWSFVIRGSKYWQENWEDKVNQYEIEITDHLYCIQNEIQDKGKWLSARRYSVSRLTMIFSDYVIFLWAIIVIIHTSVILNPNDESKILELGLVGFLSITALFILLTLIFGRSKKQSKCKHEIN